jgi:mRNA interferase MazF
MNIPAEQLFEQFDVVVVPFPFTDKTATKRRPALILSDAVTFNTPIGHSVMAMITTAAHASWPQDVIIQDLTAAGLTAPSMIRMKLFTLDHALVLKRVGKLAIPEQAKVQESLQQLLKLSAGK